MTAFKAAHRGVDVLLVDDVQFLQAEGADGGGVLPHLQRACTPPARRSSSPPTGRRATSTGFEDRLRARFEAGLVTELEPPDLATRLTILRKRVIQDGLEDVDPERARAASPRAWTRASACSRAR